MAAGVDIFSLNRSTLSVLEKTLVDSDNKTYYILKSLLQAIGGNMKDAAKTLNEEIKPLLFYSNLESQSQAGTMKIVEDLDKWVLHIDRKSLEQATPRRPLL